MGTAEHEGRYLPEPVRRPSDEASPDDDAVEALRLALAMVIGAAGLVASTIAGAVAAAAPRPETAGPGRCEGVLGMVTTVSVAGLEAGAEAMVGAARLGVRMTSGVGRVAGAAPRPGFVQSRIDAARASAAHWQARVDASQRERERAAGQAIGRAVGRVVGAVDLDAILQHVDLTAIVERVDVDRLLDGVDLNRVIGRVDLNQLLAGVDLNALVNRIDLAGIAQDVMTEVDIQEIIRSSTEGIGGEMVNTVRSQGVRSDTFVARVVDRMILRRRQRELDAPPAVDADEPEHGGAR